MKPRALVLSVWEEELGLWWQLPEAFAGDKVSSTPQWFHEGESGGGWAISPLSLVSLGDDGVAPGSKIY